MMKFLAVAVLTLLLSVSVKAHAGSPADPNEADLIPPLGPSADETPVLAVPAVSIRAELDACLDSATRMLADPAHAALNARVGPPFLTLNQKWGFLLRADFTRDDVAPPLVNRVLCWQHGQLVASKLSLPSLDSLPALSHPLAVPGAHRH